MQAPFLQFLEIIYACVKNGRFRESLEAIKGEGLIFPRRFMQSDNINRKGKGAKIVPNFCTNWDYIL